MIDDRRSTPQCPAHPVRWCAGRIDVVIVIRIRQLFSDALVLIQRDGRVCEYQCRPEVYVDCFVGHLLPFYLTAATSTAAEGFTVGSAGKEARGHSRHQHRRQRPLEGGTKSSDGFTSTIDTWSFPHGRTEDSASSRASRAAESASSLSQRTAWRHRQSLRRTVRITIDCFRNHIIERGSVFLNSFRFAAAERRDSVVSRSLEWEG